MINFLYTNWFHKHDSLAAVLVFDFEKLKGGHGFVISNIVSTDSGHLERRFSWIWIIPRVPSYESRSNKTMNSLF